MTSQHYAQDPDHFRKQCKAAAEAMERRAQEIAAEHAAKSTPERVVLTSDEDRREAINMVLNHHASDTMRLAAFRSLPMDTARLLLDELGVVNINQYLTEHRVSHGQDFTEQASPAPWDEKLGSLMARARQSNIEGLRNSVPQPKEDLTATPVPAPLEEALDITSDLSMRLAEEVDTLEAHLQPILGPENPEAEGSTDPGWDNCSPAVARVRSLNSQLAHRLRDIISIRDRLEC